MTLVIFGPTQTGKTNLAIQLAKKFNGELISVDSRQVYKKLDIGTGKVSFESQVEKHEGYWIVDGVKIHGFDIVEPESNFSVADFIAFSSKKINEIKKAKKLPIVVGGTGFYIKSLFLGIENIGVSPNDKLRKKLEKLTREELYKKLKKINLKKAQSLNDSDRNNPRRLIRAIEISISSKKIRLNKNNIGEHFLIFLTAPNAYLFQKADQWLDKRLKNGLVEEVKRLLATESSKKWLIDLGLEYRWITLFLTNKVTKPEAISRLKGDIHSLIRRQKTFSSQFKQKEIYDITKKDWQKKLEKRIKLIYTQVTNG